MSFEDQNAARFGRTQQIFHDLLSVAAEEREALLISRCGEDLELMAELRSLLASCAAEEALSAAILAGNAARQMHPDERTVGRYTLDRLLGRGGMGAVYLAHRVDGQFEQQVAVKLIDLPLATEMFRERFLQERQILAGLVHPFIARLLDGGVTDAGEPFLAMEYVDGVSLTTYCRTHKLSMRQRLELFQHVCEAVQFAHQNLVVHRDLKPDNILVLEDGTPRLLDFGTAKLLVTAENDQTAAEWTRQGLQAYTPQYASPEQVLGEPITTASDIYSLGVLLYVLAAGVLPYELKEFSTAEMLRVICNEQPPKPSTRAVNERIDPDIDAIVMKALRKEPGQRYTTVDLLSSDISAFLNGRPVQAQRGSARYLAAKFIRRNRIAFAAGCIVAATLLAGVTGVLWQSREANLQRRRAEARTADLRELSNSLLTELDSALKDIPGSTGAQKLLVTRVLEHLDRAAQDAHGDRETELDLIGAYTRLGDVQGNVYAQNVADSEGALRSFDKALALAKPLIDVNPEDQEALRAFAKATEERGETLTGLGRVEEAVAALRSAAETYDRLIALPGVTAQLVLEASTATQTLGDELCEDQGLADSEAGLAAYRRALELDERAIQLDPSYMAARVGPAYMHLEIGNVQLDVDPAQALGEFQLALRILEALPAAEQKKHFRLRLRSTLLRKEAAAWTEMAEHSRAAPLFEESRVILQQLLDADPQGPLALADMERLLDVEAQSYEYAADPVLAQVPADRRRNLQAAADLLQQDTAILRRLMKVDPEGSESRVELAGVLVRLGIVRQALHDAAGPASLQDELAVLKHAADLPKATAGDLELATSAFLNALPPSLRDPRQAVGWALREVTMTHGRNPGMLLQLAQAYHANGQTAEGIAAAQRGLSLLPADSGTHGKSRIRRLLEMEATVQRPSPG